MGGEEANAALVLIIKHIMSWLSRRLVYDAFEGNFEMNVVLPLSFGQGF